MDNEFVAKLEEVEEHFRVSLHQNGEEIFSTTLIHPNYKIIAEMMHSTLEVAIAFGFTNPFSKRQD